ncbi:inorganic diphosphatase [Anaerolineales bacterium]
MINLWHDAAAGDDVPNVFNAVIEVPKGSRNKYEYHKAYGVIKLDRVLYSPTHYPANYGFIPQSYFDDDDPMDVLVMMDDPVYPGVLLSARPLGMFKMIDGGDADYKILAVAVNDPHYSDYHDLNDVPAHFLREVQHFFKVYKELQGQEVEIVGWVGLEEAKEALLYSIQLYQERFGKKT